LAYALAIAQREKDALERSFVRLFPKGAPTTAETRSDAQRQGIEPAEP